RAFDRGVTYWYHGSRRAPGMTQAIVELVAAGKRDELVVVLQSYSRWSWLLEKTFTAGLRRLNLDHADVLLLGWHNSLPGEAILERAVALQERGLCRHIAVSGHQRPSFVRFADDSRFNVMHLRYNAAHTGAEQDIFPHLEADRRPGLVAFTATRWRSLLKAAKMPAGEAPMSARDCYRFVLSQPHIDVCMTGPADAAQVDEALTALDGGPVSEQEDARFRRIGAHVRATAGRLPF
ncbi:MAG: aldo/keto reductase, partial [Deltaproteobacteria bacterium]|nr:aldo/keto reductase [Deltaproteobacteria bacterium]